MATECNPAYLDFPMLGSRQVLADFDGGDITSDGGALLLRETERLTGVIRQFAACFDDYRDPDRIEHTVAELVAQRVYGAGHYLRPAFVEPYGCANVLLQDVTIRPDVNCRPVLRLEAGNDRAPEPAMFRVFDGKLSMEGLEFLLHPDDDSDASWEARDAGPTPHEAAVLTEMVGPLYRGLKENERTVCELRLQGYTVPEISDRIDRTEFVIEGRLKKIRRRARDWLPQDERPAGEP